jgi:thiol-disulfide isomerase/thioredoxin
MVIFTKRTMRLIRIFIIIIFVVAFTDSSAQNTENIPVVDFKQFEPQLYKSADTTFVINFWATWCVPCRKELPEFQKLYENSANKNIKLLLVSLDFPKQIHTGLIPFLEKNGITAPVILLNDPNSNAWINKVDPTWSGSLPATLIYNGQSRLFFEKELTYDSLIEAINKINKKQL